jgi:hypothetical protein
LDLDKGTDGHPNRTVGADDEKNSWESVAWEKGTDKHQNKDRRS